MTNKLLLSPDEAVQFCKDQGYERITVSTLAHWRVSGGGPVYSKMGKGWGRSGRIYYTAENLMTWLRERLEKNQRKSTSQSAA